MTPNSDGEGPACRGELSGRAAYTSWRGTAAALLALILLLDCQQPGHDEKKEVSPLGRPFDADRAFSHLAAQVEFGPRVPGTAGHGECLDYIVRHLSGAAKLLQTQQFLIECYGEDVHGTNVIASFGEDDAAPILFCCHWDTRPIADKDSDPDNRRKPILGANDGASGVAVLLELATLFAEKPPPKNVALVFLDAEDSGEFEECDYCIGSYYFARNLDSVFPKRPASNGPLFGVLIDMIGDKDLSIQRERYSVAAAPDIVARVWAVARRLGCKQFKDDLGPAVFDDHIWFNRSGIPMIDVIDFDYPFWHTMEDTVDKCSKDSLKAVGDVLYALAYED